jgi:hypothetical protein
MTLVSVPFQSSPVEFNQHLPFPSNIFDLLPKGHECFLYADLFQQIDTSRLESLYSVKGQNAYRGTAVDFTSTKLGMTLHISEKIEGKWSVLSKRWVVERTFSWLGLFR